MLTRGAVRDVRLLSGKAAASRAEPQTATARRGEARIGEARARGEAHGRCERLYAEAEDVGVAGCGDCKEDA